MFVLFNKNLNRYFKHPKAGGIWYTNDLVEANVFIENIKKFSIEVGYPELTDGFVVQEVSEMFPDT